MQDQEILLRIKSTVDYSGCYYPDDTPSSLLSYEETTIDDLINGMSDYQLGQFGIHRLKIEKSGKSLSKETKKILSDLGWRHYAHAEERHEKKVLEDKYFIMNPQGKLYSWNDPKFEEIDVDQLTDAQIDRLAKGAKIVQAVSAKSVLSTSQYQRLKDKKDKIAEAAEKKRLSKQKREENKKQKLIEKAKKLLEESGEFVA